MRKKARYLIFFCCSYPSFEELYATHFIGTHINYLSLYESRVAFNVAVMAIKWFFEGP